MNHLYLLTGSNIEPRFRYLQEANNLIEEQIGPIITKSAIYESEPWGFESDLNFINQVVQVDSAKSPQQVLTAILQIEKIMGRLRNKNGYESRIIDIDILFFNDECIQQPDLIIPHPRLHQRRFTLLPLTEIAGELMHPVYQKKNSKLLEQCPDKSFVWRIDGKSNEI